MRGFRAALAVLTRLPAGKLELADFRTAPGWFPAVGLMIGAAQAVVMAVVLSVWGPWLAALAALATGILLTGALHEDGLADTADALGSPRSAERALEIMRDSRIGAYGTLALILTLGAQVLALGGLAAGVGAGPQAALAVVVAAGLSRAPMAALLRIGPYLRATGAASGMTGPWPRGGVLAGGLALGAAAGLALWGLGGAALGGGAGLVIAATGVGVWARRRLGGITGDVLGAVQQAGFTGFLLGVLAWP
jgi:adenosylcobinamide-GDP ribazoletransferase